MTDANRTTRFRFWLWLIALIGVIVPRRLRADWRQEWAAELRYREQLLEDWDLLDWRHKLNLLWRSTSAFWDALWLQPKRLEDEMFQDLRFGMRMLLKHRVFTLVAVLTLALGIGANTAIFSVVHAVLLRELPYSEPEQLVWIWENSPKDNIKEESASVPNFVDWRNQSQSFEEMAAFAPTAPVLTSAGEPERISGTSVTANFFSTLGLPLALGRSFVGEENQPGNNRVVILSHGLWQRRFSGDPQIIGQKLTLNGNPHEVVGVMPPKFKNPQPDETRPTELWLPLAINPQAGRRSDFLRVVARLRPGLSIDQARAEMATITEGLAEQYPATNFGWGVTLVPLHERIVGNLRPALWTLTGAVAFLLLIACANVANLLLARAAARQQEIAVRTALGAGRSRLVRQFLTESVLLSLIGGISGLLVGWLGVKLLVALSPNNIPRLSEVSLSGQVFAFTSVLALLTGVIFGLVPALHAANPNLSESLKEGGRGATDGTRRRRLRSALVVSEIALALVMLVGAGLMTRSFMRLQQVDPGFNPERVVTALISLPASKYPEGAQVIAFYHQLLERVRVVPGVDSVALGSAVPLNSGSFAAFYVDGRPVPRPDEFQPDADFMRVSHDYFETLGIPLLRGENFLERYADSSPGVAIISESLAQKYFADEDPIGKRVTTANPVRAAQGPPVPWRTIIGVVADTPTERLDAPPYPQMYVPFDQTGQRSLMVIARTAGNPLATVGELRGATWSLDRDQPLYNVRTMDDVLANSVAAPRFNTLLISLFAGLGLILAAVGIYGVISYSVNQRAHEIGIRMALGAGRGGILRLIVGEGLVLTLTGVGIGLAAALALTRLLAGQLYSVSARDPLTFAVVAVVLAIVALLACYLPARRAASVDPMIALRHD